MSLLDAVGARRLVVVTGKGGVGKSTLTAALGHILVETGRTVLLMEIDPRESLYRLLGVEPSGGDRVPVIPGLSVQNLQPKDVFDSMVRERLTLPFLVDRVLASPVYDHFVNGAPGLKEMAILGHAQRILDGKAGGDGPTPDIVILDAPATGHGVSMLAAPRLVSEVITDGPFGRLGNDLAAFVSDEDQCGVFVATLAEEMPVQEAIELIGSLRSRLSRRPLCVAVNRLYPEIPAAGVSDPDDPVLDHWTHRRQVNDRELARLDEAWSGPRLDLPMLPLDRGADLVGELATVLERGLRGSEAP